MSEANGGIEREAREAEVQDTTGSGDVTELLLTEGRVVVAGVAGDFGSEP